MEILVAHPLTRLEPWSVRSWLLARTDRLGGHVINDSVAAVVARCFEPVTMNELARHAFLDARVLEPTVARLVTNEYVTVGQDAEAQRLAAVLRDWDETNWHAAAQYFFQTNGYPFEHYEADGTSKADYERMQAYNHVEPDRDRSKPPPQHATQRYGLPDVDASLAEQLATEAISGVTEPRTLDRGTLLRLLSLVCRPVGTATTPFEEAAPVFRKTSPSGGSRHPTEVYVRTAGIADLDDAWYHVAGAEGIMSSVAALESDDEDGSCLGGWQALFPSAALVFTSVFARNRYRYREPRTFRTVHMDVGHLMTTTEFVGRAFGLQVDPTTHIHAEHLAAVLQLDMLIEPPIASATVASG